MLRYLLCVVGLYAAIQSCWFLTIPPFEGPDEVQHYDHIRYVAVTGHLPDKVPARVNENDYFTGEWTQESAYYWMLGQVLRLTGVQGVSPAGTLETSLHPIFLGGTGAALYTQTAPLPPLVERGMLMMRLASVLFGLVTLLCVFAAVQDVTGDLRITTLVTSFVALVPMFGVQHVLITNDTAATMWASLASARIVRFLVRPPKTRGWRIGLASGVATGLAIATKLTAGVIVPAMPLALWWRRDAMEGRPVAIAWVAGLLGTAGVAFGRNWLVFGDPLATTLKHAVVQQFGFLTIFHPLQLGSYTALAKLLFRGSWATIGWNLWSPQELWIQAVFAILTALFLICLVLAVRTRPRVEPPPVRDALTLMLIVLALHCLAFFASISLFAGFSARYFLPLIVPMVVIAVLGGRQLCDTIGRRLGVGTLRWTLVAMPMLFALVWIGTFTACIIAYHFEGLR